MDLNFGTIKYNVSVAFKDALLNENVDPRVNQFFTAIKNSPILSQEFKIYENIENAVVKNENVLINYLNECRNKFQNFSSEDLKERHTILESFIPKESVKSEKNDLHESIHTLLHSDNITLIAESYDKITEYVKTDKKDVTESSSIEIPEGFTVTDLLEATIKIYNERYGDLNEEEKRIVNAVATENADEISEIFESYKSDTLSKLNTINGNGVKDKINEAIDNVNSLDVTGANLLKLYELNSSLV